MKNFKRFLFYLLLVLPEIVFSQKEANNWYFGTNAGITFNTGSPTALTNGKLNTDEGCATISNDKGRLLFYTDGIKVWDSTHNVTPNGTGLKGNNSSTQSGIIVPRPDSAGQYYIFTVEELGKTTGLCYSEFKMSLNSGKGDVVSSKKNIKLTDSACEKITAVKHSNGRDIWVLALRYNTDTMLSYLITPNGLSSKVVKTNTKFRVKKTTGISSSIGYLKVSPAGTKVAYANYNYDTIAFADFNTSNGIISNVWTTYVDDAYGVEFSPSSNFLYVMELNKKRLYQYNAQAGSKSAFISSQVMIDSITGTTSIGALQLGPDGKIYVSRYQHTYIDVIHAPDSSGKACRLQKNFLYLSGKRCRQGLPTFIQSFFKKNEAQYIRNCVNDSTFIWPVVTAGLDSVMWDFGDTASGSANTSKSIKNAWHIYKKTGVYKVKLYSYFKTNRDTSIIMIPVKNAKPFIGNDTSYCNLVSRKLSPQKNYIKYKWSNGDSVKTSTIKTKGTYILVATDSVKCVVSDTIVLKNSIAAPKFIPGDTSVCYKNNGFQYKNKSVFQDDSLKSFVWKLSDNTSYTDTMFNKSFGTADSFSVKLIITSKNGCKDSLSKKAVINPNTSIGFSINKTPQCFNEHDFVLTNNSTVSKGIYASAWDFGDGNTATTKDISSKKYAVDSSYKIRLVTTTNKGCRDTVTKSVIVYSGLKTAFSISTPIQCFKGNSFDFTNSSTIRTGSIANYTWNFGDGKTSTAKNITGKNYASADSFSVLLLNISDKGCRDSISKKVYVNPNISIGFSINKTPQCYNGHDFVLTNSSTLSKGTMSNSWDFGDGNTATTKDISTKTYSKDSTYKITLITTSDKGCKDTITKAVVVNPSPKSIFTINQVTQCFTYNNYDFANSSSIRTGNIASNIWNFGDGKTSTTKDITSKKYATADSFAVLLLNISDNGCRDSISKKVYVNPNTSIGFSINKTPQCYNGHDFVLSNSSTVSKGTYSNAWNFGDGSNASTKDISSKKYSIDSSYNITLITTTDKGCKDTLAKTVVVNPNPKSVYSINQTTQCLTYNSFDFANSSSIRTGNIANYSWDFGDSKSATSKDVTNKKYTTADSFVVMLLNISNNGCRDSLSKKVYINPNSNIGFSVNKTPQCFNGHDFVFTNSSTVSKGTITYNWNLGDGNTTTTQDVSSKKYAIDSTYKVTLITTTDKGCKDTISKTVVVNPNPKAGFGINQITQCFKWNRFDYTNSSTIRTGNIVSSNWSLGDADKRSSKDVKAKHYSTEDSFKVDLLTISNNGCRDSSTKWVYLLNSPKPDFVINKDTQCFNGHDFSYQNNSTIGGGNFSSLWQLGDATTNTNKDVSTKQYSVYGNYKVLLILTSNNNCKDSLQKTVRINPNSLNKFTIDKDRQCFRGNVFNYTNQSAIAEGTITYNWNLGDASTFTTKDVLNHKYSTEDTFNIRLITTSDKNCKDTLTKMVVTFAQPVAKFIVPQDSQCWQKHFFIINNNTTLKYGTMTHFWDFGDGTKDFSYTPSTKTYQNKSANYTLKYKVTSDHGCTDSAQKKVSLLERPISVFTVNDSIQCFRTNSFSFTNKTTFSDLTTLSYIWNYGDGSKTTGKNPKSLSYPTANYYTVQLIASSYLNNCVDTLNKIMVVAPHATPDYIIDNDSQCLRTNKFTFTNLSKVKFGTLKYSWNFGDNTKDTATNPVKKYNSGSNYSVKLVATTNYDCKDSISKPTVIIPHPISNFTVADSTLCKVQSLNITNKTTILYGTYTQVWHFDEGVDETGLNVNGKKLTASGFHPVRLAVVSNFGCTDTITKNVFVEQSGTTKISIVENDSQCLRGNKTQFNVFSQGGIINLSSYIWQFGDGNSATTQNPTHTYTKDSSFKVSAETVSSNGCLDTAYFDMVIHPLPVTDFTANSPCFPNPVIFNNLSKIKSGSIVSQNWDLDGAKSSLLNPTSTYTSFGTFTIKLKNYSNYGCADSGTKQIIVKAKPTAMFSYTQLPSADEIKLQLDNKSSMDVITNNWDFGDGTFSQDQNPIASFKDSGRFNILLEVINSEGCKDTFKLKTDLFYPDFVFYLPNVFSPNGNGVNDVFKPIGSQYNRKYSMEIFNRWGEKIFETHDVNQGWDGKYLGEDCQDGIYHCYVHIMPVKGALKTYHTAITLLR